MDSLSIKVNVTWGTTLDDAVIKAQKLADRLGVIIEFDFNGKYIFISPGCSTGKALEVAYKAFGEDHISPVCKRSNETKET